MRSVLLLLSLAFITPAQAGYTPPPTMPSLLDHPLPAPREEKQTCGYPSGLSRADRVAECAHLLAQKWLKVTEARTCEFDGESITVTPTATGFVTSVDGASVLTYSSAKEDPSRVVVPSGSTWSPPVCPPTTIEAVMNEQLRRAFACFPEEGHRVTTRAEDEAHRKAAEAAQLEWARRALDLKP